jgi:hypothetical protein
VKHSTEIYNELKDISPLLSEIEKTNVFSIPENYFLDLDRQILKRIKAASAPEGEKEQSASVPHFSDVPEGYFNSLPDTILRRIKSIEAENAAEELRQLSPMLYSVQNENVFSVPKGYFENLPDTIINAVKPQAKIVTIKKRSTVWEYAAAAMLAGVMAVSALWIGTNSSKQNVETTAANTIPSYIKEASQYKNEQQINEGISTLGDDDIINYLEATGNSGDEATLAKIIQEKELPSEEDYLLNEQTLENFLGKKDLKSNEN